jgi:hypothetical protein
MWRDEKKPVEIVLHSAVKKHKKIGHRFKKDQAYAVTYKDASGSVVNDEFVFQVRVHLFLVRFAHLICIIFRVRKACSRYRSASITAFRGQ